MAAKQREVYRAVCTKNIETLNGRLCDVFMISHFLNIRRRKREEAIDEYYDAFTKGFHMPSAKTLFHWQAANHPYLFDGVEDRSLPPYGDHILSSCGLKQRVFLLYLSSMFTR